MSRGLGRVEKKILEFLNDEQITKERRTKFRHVPDIVVYVYDIEYPHYGRNGDPPDDTEFLDLIKKGWSTISISLQGIKTAGTKRTNQIKKQ